MALIIETGTGSATAESYISVADATTYQADRGNAAWAAVASDTVREQLLRKATDFMVEQYRTRWAGGRVLTTQALDWPRYQVPRLDVYGSSGFGFAGYGLYYPSDEVPEAVRRACAEFALRAIDGDLGPDLSAPVIREKVGPIEVQYAEGARQEVRYSAIDKLLEPFLLGSESLVRVQRA